MDWGARWRACGPVPREHEGALVVGHFAEHWVLMEEFRHDPALRIHLGGGVDEAYADFVGASRGVRGAVGHVVAGSVLYVDCPRQFDSDGGWKIVKENRKWR